MQCHREHFHELHGSLWNGKFDYDAEKKPWKQKDLFKALKETKTYQSGILYALKISKIDVGKR